MHWMEENGDEFLWQMCEDGINIHRAKSYQVKKWGEFVSITSETLHEVFWHHIPLKHRSQVTFVFAQCQRLCQRWYKHREWIQNHFLRFDNITIDTTLNYDVKVFPR